VRGLSFSSGTPAKEFAGVFFSRAPRSIRLSEAKDQVFANQFLEIGPGTFFGLKLAQTPQWVGLNSPPPFRLRAAARQGFLVYKTVYMRTVFGSIPEIQKLVGSTSC
jgi:hypothetical protein